MDKYIDSVVSQIVNTVKVNKIILFSRKQDLAGTTLSFKICVIIPDGEQNECEKQIYLKVDSDIPFDVIVYTLSDWEKHITKPGSFGHKVNKNGSVIYG